MKPKGDKEPLTPFQSISTALWLLKQAQFYKRHQKYLKPEITSLYERGYNPMEAPNVHYIRDHETSMALNRSSESKVIISASGMCELVVSATI